VETFPGYQDIVRISGRFQEIRTASTSPLA